MRELIIDGTNLLTTYGVWIAGNNVYNNAEANVETVKVPGRNGDLVYSNRRYNNLTITYPAAIPANMTARIEALKGFLYSNLGYRMIKDSYFPTMYRMGRISGNINPTDIGWNNDSALFSISFDCKPQHYLDSGLIETEYTSGATIANPTQFEALPLMRIYGYGTVTLNGTNVTVEENNYPWVDVDCEIQDGYNGTTNLNMFLTVSGDRFPVLSPGSNTLTLGTGITKVAIKPRWWTL